MPVLLWCAAIFYATSSPAYTGQHTGQVVGEVLPAASHATADLVNMVVRKTTHVLAFGLLAALAWWALRPGAVGGAAPERAARRRAFWAWGFATLYAASDEFHQLFVPGRSGEVRDVLLDSLAAVIIVVLLTMMSLQRRLQREQPRRRKLT